MSYFPPQKAGTRRDAVGWGTALQAGRSRVQFPMKSLEFFIDLFLQAALWPWGRLSLEQKWVSGLVPWGDKVGGRVGLTALPTTFMCRLSWNSGSLKLSEPKGPVQACVGIALPLPHNTPPLASVLSRMNPVHTLTSYSLTSILIVVSSHFACDIHWSV
jgi:hypothetical protein